MKMSPKQRHFPLPVIGLAINIAVYYKLTRKFIFLNRVATGFRVMCSIKNLTVDSTNAWHHPTLNPGDYSQMLGHKFSYQLYGFRTSQAYYNLIYNPHTNVIALLHYDVNPWRALAFTLDTAVRDPQDINILRPPGGIGSNRAPVRNPAVIHRYLIIAPENAGDSVYFYDLLNRQYDTSLPTIHTVSTDTKNAIIFNLVNNLFYLPYNSSQRFEAYSAGNLRGFTEHVSTWGNLKNELDITIQPEIRVAGDTVQETIVIGDQSDAHYDVPFGRWTITAADINKELIIKVNPGYSGEKFIWLKAVDGTRVKNMRFILTFDTDDRVEVRSEQRFATGQAEDREAVISFQGRWNRMLCYRGENHGSGTVAYAFTKLPANVGNNANILLTSGEVGTLSEADPLPTDRFPIHRPTPGNKNVVTADADVTELRVTGVGDARGVAVSQHLSQRIMWIYNRTSRNIEAFIVTLEYVGSQLIATAAASTPHNILSVGGSIGHVEDMQLVDNDTRLVCKTTSRQLYVFNTSSLARDTSHTLDAFNTGFNGPFVLYGDYVYLQSGSALYKRPADTTGTYELVHPFPVAWANMTVLPGGVLHLSGYTNIIQRYDLETGGALSNIHRPDDETWGAIDSFRATLDSTNYNFMIGYKSAQLNSQNTNELYILPTPSETVLEEFITDVQKVVNLVQIPNLSLREEIESTADEPIEDDDVVTYGREKDHAYDNATRNSANDITLSQALNNREAACFISIAGHRHIAIKSSNAAVTRVFTLSGVLDQTRDIAPTLPANTLYTNIWSVGDLILFVFSTVDTTTTKMYNVTNKTLNTTHIAHGLTRNNIVYETGFAKGDYLYLHRQAAGNATDKQMDRLHVPTGIWEDAYRKTKSMGNNTHFGLTDTQIYVPFTQKLRTVSLEESTFVFDNANFYTDIAVDPPTTNSVFLFDDSTDRLYYTSGGDDTKLNAMSVAAVKGAVHRKNKFTEFASAVNAKITVPTLPTTSRDNSLHILTQGMHSPELRADGFFSFDSLGSGWYGATTTGAHFFTAGQGFLSSASEWGALKEIAIKLLNTARTRIGVRLSVDEAITGGPHHTFIMSILDNAQGVTFTRGVTSGITHYRLYSDS